MKKNKQSTKLLGAEVRQAREILGEVTQQNLADIIGSSQSEVSRWEGKKAHAPIPKRFAERIRKLLYRHRLGLPLIPSKEELIEYHPPSHAPADSPRVFLSFARKPKPSPPPREEPPPAPPGEQSPPAPTQPQPPTARWSARVELRALAACLFVLISGAVSVLRSELRDLRGSHRPTPVAHSVRARAPTTPPPPPAEPPAHSTTAVGSARPPPPAPDAPDGGVVWDMAQDADSEPEPEGAPDQTPPARQVPDHPFRNQKRPPCLVPPKGSEVELKGACYVKIAQKPPCAKDAYESEGECYIAIARREPGNSFEH